LAEIISRYQALMHIEAVASVKAAAFSRKTEIQSGLKQDDVQSVYESNALRIARHTTDTIDSNLRARIADGRLKNKSNGEIAKELEKAFNQFGIPGFSKGQVNTIVTTQLLVAKAAGEWNTYEAMGDDLWGFKYLTAGDDRVRPSHEAMDGTKLPKDDPFWETAWPPNGWNCRCEVVPIFGKSRRVTRSPSPDREFAFNPGEGYRTRVPGKLTGGSTIDRKIPPKPLSAPQARAVSEVPRVKSGTKEFESTLDRAIQRSRQTRKSVSYASVNATDFHMESLKPGSKLSFNKHVVAKNRLANELLDDPNLIIRTELKPGDVAVTADPETLILSGKRNYIIKNVRKRNGVNIITLLQK
ncbi:MAG: phage minor head protein, partial [Kangiellaceae bacterium]|nr:phage minor head protein [Kangiellaceae bacterium]